MSIFAPINIYAYNKETKETSKVHRDNAKEIASKHGRGEGQYKILAFFYQVEECDCDRCCVIKLQMCIRVKKQV
jgi:hypothetical protein